MRFLTSSLVLRQLEQNHQGNYSNAKLLSNSALFLHGLRLFPKSRVFLRHAKEKTPY